jgi:hypothetical protein
MSKLLRVFATGLIPIFLFGCGGEPRSDRSPSTDSKAGPSTEAPPIKQPLGKPEATLTAAALWEEFGANALQSDSKYKGKVLKVTGTFRTIDPNEGGRYSVGFEVFPKNGLPTGQYQRVSDLRYPPMVICYLDPGDQSNFEEEAKKGPVIEVLGRCVGRKNDPPRFQDYIVVLEDCRVLRTSD